MPKSGRNFSTRVAKGLAKGSLLLGYVEGKPLVLSVRDRSMMMLLLGTIGVGKTTAMEGFIMQDISAGASLTLIDPMGALYKRILAYLCYQKATGIRVPEVVLFNPSEGLITPYNPFAKRDDGDLGVAVDRRVTAILRAWGQTNSDNTPRLERWLRCLITVLIECGLTLVDAGFLIEQKNAAIRERFAAGLHNPMIRAKFEALSSYKPAEFNEQLESVENRLMRFLTSDTMRRMLGTGLNVLDFSTIINAGKILLCNGQPSKFLSREQQRLIFTLILTEIYEVGLQRPSGSKPHYVYVDEAHRFITPELAEALETTRQKGIHYCLGAQHLSQFKTPDGDDRVYKAVKSCVRNKLIFAIPDRQDAAEIADDVFSALSEPEVKLVRKTLNHLIEDVRDQSTSKSEGSSSSWEASSGSSRGTTQASSRSEGLSSSKGRSTSRERSAGTARTFSRGKTSEIGSGESRTHSENESHTHGFSETTGRGRSSSSASSRSETVQERSSDGIFFDTSDAARSVTKGGSDSHSESESYSRTDTGNDSYSSGYSRTTSKSTSRGGSKSLSWSRSRGISEGASQSEGMSESSEWSRSNGASESRSIGNSEGQSQSRSYSVTDQPSTRHHPFWERHEEYWTLEEKRWRASESLMLQDTAFWYASTLAGSGFGSSRMPRKYYIQPNQLLRLTGQLQEKCCLSPARADEMLSQSQQDLFSVPSRTESAMPSPTTGRERAESPIWSWNRTGNPTSIDASANHPGLKPRRGPKPNLENHGKVVQVINSYGENWATDENLCEICEMLDKQNVPVPKTWSTLAKHPARSWRGAFLHHRDLIKKAIRYSIQVTRGNEPQT